MDLNLALNKRNFIIIPLLIVWFFSLGNFCQGEEKATSKSKLHIENLGPIVESATLQRPFQFHLPKVNQSHLLLYYVVLESWRQPFQVWDINLDSGANRVTEGLLGQPGPYGTLLHSNGLVYIASEDPGFFMVYDPATGESRKIEKLADKGAQYIIEGDDGAVYLGECVKGCVERYNPKDQSWENYGIIDDPGPPYYRYAYTLGADGHYVYIGMGENPWYLVIYDRLNKTHKVYWKDQKLLSLSIEKGQGGGVVCPRPNRRRERLLV